jgi:hypothetical protein
MTSKRGLQTAESIEQRLGDAVLIRARTPHRWQNAGRSTAQALLVSSRGAR